MKIKFKEITTKYVNVKIIFKKYQHDIHTRKKSLLHQFYHTFVHKCFYRERKIKKKRYCHRNSAKIRKKKKKSEK